MKKYTFIIIVLIAVKFSFSQNLVPNYSFENGNCPFDQDQIYFSQPWFSSANTPDYFNACDTSNVYGVPYNAAGYQNAYSGNAYSGFFASASTYLTNNYREIISCKLNKSLIIGKKYYVSIKICLADSFNCGINKVGVLFSKNTVRLNVNKFQNFAHIYTENIITDMREWSIIKGDFVADSNYQFINIGNFFDNNNIDSVIYNKSVDCNINPFFCYEKNQCCAYYYLDDVCVSNDSVTCDLIQNENIKSNNKNIVLYPNPATDKIYFNFQNNYDLLKITIFNNIGTLMWKAVINENNIDISKLKDGIYFININNDSFNYNFKFNKLTQ